MEIPQVEGGCVRDSIWYAVDVKLKAHSMCFQRITEYFNELKRPYSRETNLISLLG